MVWMDMYTLLYLKWIANKSMGNCEKCWVAAWLGGVFGREWIRVCMAESPPCSSETITTLLTSYIPIQNKKLKKNKSHRISATKNKVITEHVGLISK